MHSTLKLTAALLVNLSLLGHQVIAQLPPISFETYESVPLDLSSPDPWEPIHGSSAVTPAGQGFGGGKALKIGGDPQEEAWLRKPVTWNSAETVAFIDFRIKPAATAAGSQANFLANGSQLAFQLSPNSTAGELWVLHGNDDAVAIPPGSPLPLEKWYQSAGTFTVPANSPVSTTWLRATLRHDYQRKIWDLFIDGKLAAVNLGFEGRGANLTELEFFGSLAGDTLIDNLEANPSNMLFPDADKDGLPDAWEIANGSNPNLYDRDAIDPVTGKSFLNKYLDSLWNAQSPGTPVNGAAGLGNVGTVPPLTILDSHQPVGALKGQFAVGGDGAATYTIPLDIPKGRAGMEPKLSLNYSSNAGNGPLGVGWSIGGLQKITRGPSSLKKDGIADGADFDANDRFYLDGERLVCVSTGVNPLTGQLYKYGDEGSEYRTELDSFARIKAVGQMIQQTPNGPVRLGPASWTVETKSGLKITLGNSTGSKVQVDSFRILSWLVTQVADTTGRNAYEVDYCDNVEAPAAPTSSGRYPWKVRYTIDPTTSDNGFCSMNFDYEARPDLNSGYVHGAKQESLLRLKQVAVSTDTYLNHAYNFFYTTSQQTGRSLLYGVDKEAADGSRVPATSFQWETLSHSAPKWVEAGHLDFNEYGNGQDSGSSMASYVSVSQTDPTEIHLTGNAWRTYPISDDPLQPTYTVTPNTWLEFKYRTLPDSGALSGKPKWGMIGLDEDALTANPKRVFKIVGGTLPPIPTYNSSSWEYTRSDGEPDTIRIHVGQHFTGQMRHLVLVSDDNTVNNGVGESWFRNVQLFEGNPTAGGVMTKSVHFDQAIAAPQILDGNNEDLGVRIQDMDGDGLPDIAYNLLYGKTSGTGAVTLQTFGQALRNTGSEFVNDAKLKLPPSIPTGNLPGAGEGQFANSQAIYPVPVDINADGQLDFAYAKNLTRESNGTFTCEHGYLTRVNNAWVELTAYAHHFKSNCVTSQKRFSHFEHIDLDSDGDLDLLVHPYGASLTLLPGKPNTLPLASFPMVGNSGSNSGVAYLNKFQEGPGWVGTSDWRLPVPLRIPGFNSNGGEVGRSIQDLNGDGRPDLYSALWQANKNVWLNKDDATGWNPIDSGSIHQVPENLTNSNGDDVGTRLVDVNGDGKVDVIKALGSGSLNLQVGVSLNTGNSWIPHSGTTAPWLPEENFNTIDKRKEVQEQGTSFVDINADGLVDFVVSKPTINTVALNTGSDFWPESTRDPNTNVVTHNPFWASPGTNPPVPGANANGSWRLPNLIYPNTTASTNGIRHAMLVDLNGDGVSDLIGDMKSPVPKIWINQAKPERIISFTDGYAASIQVDTYARLNDPTPVPNSLGLNRRVYDKTPVTDNDDNTTWDSFLPGHVSLCDSRWVVARYSEPDGMGGRRYRSQYYRDLRHDKANEASLGFGQIEVHDEVTRGYTVTQTRRDYPFAGSSHLTESYAFVSGAMPHQPGIAAGLHHRVSQETSSYGTLGETTGPFDSESRPCGKVRRPVQLGSVAKKFDLAGTTMSHLVTTQVFDPHDTGFGFVKSSTVVSQLDGSATATTNAYDHIITTGTSPKWHLGRLTSSTVAKSALGKTTLTKSSTFTYHATTGLLTSERVLPEAPDQALFFEKTYGHDPFGNVTSTAVRANKTLVPSVEEETRTSSTMYDGYGRFPTSETTALGTIYHSYSHKRALLLSTTDLDDRKTTFTYDTFGTKLATNFPDQTRSAEITRFVTNADLPAGVSSKLGGGVVRWARSAQASATPWSTVYLDSLGREIVTETVVMTGFNGTASTFANQYSITVYDTRGRKEKTSTPFLAGETPFWTTVQYDVLDRPYMTTRPDGTTEGIDTTPVDVRMPLASTNSIGVSGVKAVIVNGQPVSYVRSYNAKGHKLERWTDQHGRMIYSRDASGQLTAFHHDVEGRVTLVAIDGTVQLTNVFDKVGNKTAVTDLSGGTSTSSFNGFGEVKIVTSPRGTIKTDYDSSGRVISVERPNEEAASPATVTYTTTYNPAKPGKGKPWSVDGPNGYQEVLTYGSATRDYGKLTIIAKIQKAGATAYVKTTEYNALGLVMSESFSGDALVGEDDVQVVHDYDTVYGSFETRTRIAGTRAATLSQLVSVARSGDRIISTEKLAHEVQRVTETDARNGRILQITSTRPGETLQNLSYTWDNNGNLTSRTTSLSGETSKTETFQYDTDGKGLDRLASSTVANQSPVNYSYDDKGNLTGKGGNTNSYSGYRVTSATIKGQSRTYSYDNAGYVIGDGKRTYTWTAFGQLKSVKQISCPAADTFAATGIYTTLPGIPSSELYAPSEAEAKFEFDASGSRATQILVRKFSQTSEARVITRYNGSYELEEHATGPGGGSYQTFKQVHRHRLGNALLASEVPYQNGVAGAAAHRLAVILTDHIGSTDVIVRGEWQNGRWTATSQSSDLNNPRAERQSFDAWGGRRDQAAWTDLHPSHDSRRKTSAMDQDRGFTGHEMLDDFGLIHMNGRIYDSELGRFLSPDPYVQVPEYSQNFNRYSYVLNNPLSYTDPTGYEVSGLWAAIIVIVVIVVVVVSFGSLSAPASSMGAALLGQTATAAVTSSVGAWAVSAIGGAFLGGLSGGLNAALTGGNFGDVLRGGTVGGIQGAISGSLLHGMSPEGAGYSAGFNARTALHVAGHGVVGGSANAAMGGKFEDGFISGAVSAAAADAGLFDFIPGESNLAVAGRTALAGIIGGTASALGGGKFANGALTAAVQHFLNFENSKDEQIAYYEQQTGEKLGWMARLFFKHEAVGDAAVGAANFAGGVADGASFGLSEGIANAVHGKGSWVDKESGLYTAGAVTGIAATTLATGGASGGARGVVSSSEVGRYLSVGPGAATAGSFFSHGWIKRSLFKDLPQLVGKADAAKFKAALGKGLVGPKGESGIKILRESVNGYTHELKIGGSAQRLLGKMAEGGYVEFSRFVRGGLH